MPREEQREGCAPARPRRLSTNVGRSCARLRTITLPPLPLRLTPARVRGQAPTVAPAWACVLRRARPQVPPPLQSGVQTANYGSNGPSLGELDGESPTAGVTTAHAAIATMPRQRTPAQDDDTFRRVNSGFAEAARGDGAVPWDPYVPGNIKLCGVLARYPGRRSEPAEERRRDEAS